MMSLFFSKEGKHIVCGGSTSTLVARYLGKKLESTLDFDDPEIPPIAKIEGVDLVTEGVITINKVLDLRQGLPGGEHHVYGLEQQAGRRFPDRPAAV